MRQTLKDYEDVGVAMAEPDADIDALMAKMDRLQTEIDANNGCVRCTSAERE
jgi:hypothetical protein